jgi:hypothetical protein
MDRLSPLVPGADVALPVGDMEPDEAGAGRGLQARLNGGSPLDAGGQPAGTTKLDFGRYAGWTLRDIARQEPDYLRWLIRHSSGIRFRNEIRRLLRDEAGAYAPPPASR